MLLLPKKFFNCCSDN